VGVLTEYFIARDDADAARAHSGREGRSRRDFRPPSGGAVDPVVCLAVLDEGVTGRNAIDCHVEVPADLTPDRLPDALSDLVRLPYEARTSGGHLYCWVSL